MTTDSIFTTRNSAACARRGRTARSVLLRCAVLGAPLLLGACAASAPRPVIVPAIVTVPTDGAIPAALDSIATPDIARERVLAADSGEATYYASMFHGRRTASGIVFSNDELYAAHREYPFGTVVRVTNARNGREVVVEVVDRGPNGTSERAQRTIIDLSQRAADILDFLIDGRIPVLVEVLSWGDG